MSNDRKIIGYAYTGFPKADNETGRDVMDNWGDVVERALDFVLERKKFKKGDLTLEEYECAKGEMRAAGRVFVEAALEEAATAAIRSHSSGMAVPYDWTKTVGEEIADAIRALKDKLP